MTPLRRNRLTLAAAAVFVLLWACAYTVLTIVGVT